MNKRVALIASLLCGIWIANAQPQIEVNPFNFNFGEVAVADTARLTLYVTSTGTQDLTIDFIYVPEGFGTYFLDPVVLAPGEEYRPLIVFMPTSQIDYYGDMSITSDDPDGPLIFPLTGTGVTRILTIEPATLEFGEIPWPYEPVTQTIELTSVGSGILTVMGLDIPDGVSVEHPNGWDHIYPGDHRIYSVTIQDALLLAWPGDSLWIFSDDYNSPHLVLIHAWPWQSGAESPPSQLADRFILEQNYPNPFNAETTISYYLPVPAIAEISIFDAAGRHVARFTDGSTSVGRHTVNFSARDLPSGLYFCRLRAGEFEQTRKMVLLK